MAPSPEQPQVIYTPNQFTAILDAGRLPEIQQWLTANGIEPNDVPQHTPMSIETIDGLRYLRYSVYLQNEDGSRYADPHQAAQGKRTAPLVVEPPAWMSA